MFTGIVEEVGTVAFVGKGTSSCVLGISAERVLEDVQVGDSIAVNGVCLTVTHFDVHGFEADVMPETLNRSSLAELRCKSPVNLERAMAANGRFGGHIVSGHIDGTGTVRAITTDDNAVWFTIAAAPEILRYVVEKGSIAIDGISLTVAAVNATSFKVSVIPHTRANTALSATRVGSTVNLECDIIAKYVERLLSCSVDRTDTAQQAKDSRGLTKEFLLMNGF